jgi:hypothetical protein
MTSALVFMKLSSAVVFGLCEFLLFSAPLYSPHILTYKTLSVHSPYNNNNAEMTFFFCGAAAQLGQWPPHS